MFPVLSERPDTPGEADIVKKVTAQTIHEQDGQHQEQRTETDAGSSSESGLSYKRKLSSTWGQQCKQCLIHVLNNEGVQQRNIRLQNESKKYEEQAKKLIESSADLAAQLSDLKKYVAPMHSLCYA